MDPHISHDVDRLIDLGQETSVALVEGLAGSLDRNYYLSLVNSLSLVQEGERVFKASEVSLSGALIFCDPVVSRPPESLQTCA